MYDREAVLGRDTDSARAHFWRFLSYFSPCFTSALMPYPKLARQHRPLPRRCLRPARAQVFPSLAKTSGTGLLASSAAARFITETELKDLQAAGLAAREELNPDRPLHIILAENKEKKARDLWLLPPPEFADATLRYIANERLPYLLVPLMRSPCLATRRADPTSGESRKSNVSTTPGAGG